ncbi:MAG: DUF362 domain-containing protein [bacterium]|nr:DUF362 domain-containing protein [bacterium]
MKHSRQVFHDIAAYPTKLWRWISGRFFWSLSFLGISSLVWLILRSAARPTRLTYPCQKVAAANVHAWAGVSALGFLSRFRRKAWHLLTATRAFPIALPVVVAAVIGLVGARSLDWGGNARLLELEKAAAEMEEILAPSPSVFVVEKGGGPDGMRHAALDRLINLMGVHGVCFYRTGQRGIASSPDGLIGPEDVVLIKVNCQWAERGGSNTDVLKGLISRITEHPDGFAGEIVVADNGQDVGIGGSLDWANSNAEDHSQSAQDVVNLFSGSYKVSTYLWTTIRNRQVSEFDQNDNRDGYVLADDPDPNSNFRVSHPKFTTPYGTQISLKRGIYTPGKPIGTYNKERLKVINLPVLKSHSGFAVTGCVKHYVGVQSQPLSNGHGRLSSGSMGSLFADLGLPTLNILDATYVNPNPMGQTGNGPSTSYTQALKMDTLMASLDPFALDYWASKNVLIPAAKQRGYTNVDSMDPDKSGAFRTYLQAAKNIVLLSGQPVTTDPDKITVYRASDERPLCTGLTVAPSVALNLNWLEIAPGSFQYTVEQSTDLAATWEAVPGQSWPILETECTLDASAAGQTCFYRIRRDPGPK